MGKAKALKIAGFVVALGASGALVATAATGTGAYFTDSHDGSIVATAGTLHLDATASDLNVNFTGLVPGVDQTKTVGFSASAGSSNQDVWIVFDSNPSDAGSTAYGAFTGSKGVSYGSGNWTTGGLGGYGHFKVHGDQGWNFESYNLEVATAGIPACSIDGNGNGGSSAKASGTDNATQAAPECGVPGAIKVAGNIAPGQGHSVDITFGLTGKATDQNAQYAAVPFKLVATQVNGLPTAGNF